MGFGDWNPTKAVFKKGLPTSARTALVETDIGLGYLKAMGAPEGLHTLASEVVVTQLATWFKLPTFEWAIIRIDEFSEIPFLDKLGNRTGQATPGPAFITKSEPGETWGGKARLLKLLVNPQDISRLVVFDTWVLNCDRHSVSQDASAHHRKPNRDNVFLSRNAPRGRFLLKAMDHTHCLNCGRDWTRKLAQVDTIRDSRVFGLFPEFRNFLNRDTVREAVADLKKITNVPVAKMTEHVPKEWEVTREAMDAVIELIVGRAAYVADTIESRIWPQGTLFPKDRSGDS